MQQQEIAIDNLISLQKEKKLSKFKYVWIIVSIFPIILLLLLINLECLGLTNPTNLTSQAINFDQDILMEQLNTLLKTYQGIKSYYYQCKFSAKKLNDGLEIELFFQIEEQIQILTYELKSIQMTPCYKSYKSDKFCFENIRGQNQIFIDDLLYRVESNVSYVEISFYNYTSDKNHEHVFSLEIIIKLQNHYKSYDLLYLNKIINEQNELDLFFNYSDILDHKAINYCIMVSIISIIQIIGALKLRNQYKNVLLIARQFSPITFGIIFMQDAILGIIHFSLFSDSQKIYFLFPGVLEIFLCLLVGALIIQIQIEKVYPQSVAFIKAVYGPLNFIIFIFPILSCLLGFKEFMMTLNFFLVPQIYYLVSNNQETQLNLSFVGLLISNRIILPMYFCLCPFNVFTISVDLFTSFLLAFTFVTQFAIYILQCKLGPQFFIPRRCQKKHHNYYVIKSGNECSICLASLDQMSEYAIYSSNQMLSYILLRNRFMQMKTPCKHYFHSLCLIIWMTNQQTCPLCRSFLPPLI